MDSRSALAPYWKAWRVALAALILTTSGLLAFGPSLQTVRLVVANGATSVILSADGALPSPVVGVLPNPPRIYLDFPGVTAATEGTRANGDLLVRGVRVAVNQSQPLVTRVVIDLARPAPYRIDAGLRASGQLTIVVGVPVALAGEPADRAARSPEFARAAGTTAARTPAKDIARVPAASLIPARTPRTAPPVTGVARRPGRPPGGAVEGGGAGVRVDPAGAGGHRPPRTLAATHELFRDVCVLGAASAAARVAPAAPDDPTRAWNAAAAAAGAIILLDRARAEVGLAAGLRAASDSVVAVSLML